MLFLLCSANTLLSNSKSFPPYSVNGKIINYTHLGYRGDACYIVDNEYNTYYLKVHVSSILRLHIRNQENMTPAEIVARGLIAAQKIIEEREKEIVHLNNRCGRLTQTIAEKQDVINAISRNVPAPTKRMMLNRVMRRRSPELAQSRWSYLYARFDEIFKSYDW